ncbi:MAG: hypothetical protein IJ725_00150 [Ruminococcus sp.]|nr:hypothetical protein [Ruminococcus sp.]
MIERELARLIIDVKTDEKLRDKFSNIRESGDPMKSFCDICLKNGYEIYLGELFAYGQDMNDSKLRATNGGGSFEIDGWSDAFENILDEIYLSE